MIAKEIVLWALRKRRPWRVQGTSMEPDYCAGDLVLIDPARRVTVGSVVVARHPFKNVELIKYVKSVDADDHVVLESPNGDDSDQFGRVPLHTVRGTVTFNWKARRAS
jgi:phage repressor protein C with HTH and peptisase S24 domain